MALVASTKGYTLNPKRTKLMIRFSSLAIAGACALTLSAAADSAKYETVNAEFSYDIRLLDSETGATDVFKQIVREANKACRIRAPFAGRSLVDKVCQKDLVFKAVAAIDNDRLNKVYAASSMKIDAPKRAIELASL